MMYSALNAMTVVLPEPGPEQQQTRCSHHTSHNSREQFCVGFVTMLQAQLPLDSVWQMTAGELTVKMCQFMEYTLFDSA